MLSYTKLNLIKNIKRLLKDIDQVTEEKEKFILPVANPINGELIEWPLINISNVQDYSIYQINVVSNLPFYLSEKIGEEISKKLLKI